MGATRSPFHLLVVLGAHVPDLRVDANKEVASSPTCADSPCGFGTDVNDFEGSDLVRDLLPDKLVNDSGGGDSQGPVVRSALVRRLAVDVPSGDASVVGVPATASVGSNASRYDDTDSSQVAHDLTNSTALPSLRNLSMTKEYFCRKLCVEGVQIGDGLLVPWSVLEQLGPIGEDIVLKTAAAADGLTCQASDAPAGPTKGDRRITLVMSRDNVAALVVISCLSMLGAIYLWKIATRHSCHCRICRNQYRQLHLLGSGGYGSVHLVERLGDLQAFVSKKIPIRDLTEVDEYSREAKDLVQLRHRHIVSYEEDFVHVEYGALEPKTYFIIIMEYCPEGDLKEKIENEFMNFTEEYVRTIFAQLLQAVQYLHSKNVIHRDLKSQNVFLASDGLVRLGDFGLCRRGGENNAMCGNTATLTHAGTDCYMAPEMLSSSKYGKPADMWSLGCVLYELCTGQFMWELDGILGAMIMKDAHCVQKLVHDNIAPAVGSALASLLKRLLSANPAMRPTTTTCIRKRLFKKGFQLSRERFGEGLEPEADAEEDSSCKATTDIPLTVNNFCLPSDDEDDGVFDRSCSNSSGDDDAEASQANISPATQKQNRKRRGKTNKGRGGGRR